MARKQMKSQVEWELARRASVAGNGPEAMRARVRAARLSEAQLLCLSMLWYHSLNQEEVSQALQVSQQAVSSHVARGLERLKTAGVSRRRRRRFMMPQMLQAPPSWLDQLAPEEVKAGW